MRQHESQTSRPGSHGTESSRLPQRAHEATERLRGTALDRAEQARDRVREGFGEGRQQVVKRIRGVSSALRSTSEALKESDEVVARYAEEASRRIDRAAEYVSSTEPQDLARDVARFARRQPALFFGGAFFLGLVAGRFAKSSRPWGEEEYESSSRFRRTEPRRGVSEYDRPYGAPIQPKPTESIGGAERTPSSMPAGTATPSAQEASGPPPVSGSIGSTGATPSPGSRPGENGPGSSEKH